MNSVGNVPKFGAKTFFYNTSKLPQEEIAAKFPQYLNGLNGYSMISQSLSTDKKPSERTDVILLHTDDDANGKAIHEKIQAELKVPASVLLDTKPKGILGKLVEKAFGRRGPVPLELPWMMMGQLAVKPEGTLSQEQFMTDVKSTMVSKGMMPKEDDANPVLKGFYKYYAKAIVGWEKTAEKMYQTAFPKND